MALDRLKQLVTTSPQTAKWLFRKGQILESTGRWAEAEAAYLESGVELGEQLRGSRKNRSLLALEEQILQAQRRMESRNPVPGESQ